MLTSEELSKDWLLICPLWRTGLIGWAGTLALFCSVSLGLPSLLALDSSPEIKSFKDFDASTSPNEKVALLFSVLRVAGLDNSLLE